MKNWGGYRMQDMKGKIKIKIEEELKYMRVCQGEEKLFVAKTINELIRAWHNTERPYYKKRPHKNKHLKVRNKGGNISYEITDMAE